MGCVRGAWLRRSQTTVVGLLQFHVYCPCTGLILTLPYFACTVTQFRSSIPPFGLLNMRSRTVAPLPRLPRPVRRRLPAAVLRLGINTQFRSTAVDAWTRSSAGLKRGLPVRPFCPFWFNWDLPAQDATARAHYRAATPATW